MTTKTTEDAAAIAPTAPAAPSPFEPSLKIATYAATGGRKTLQIGHLIKEYGAENVGIISCEHGLGTIRSRVDPRYVYTVHRLRKSGDDTADMQSAWAWAHERFNGPHQWVCVDGGSRVLDWVRGEIFGGAQAALEAIIAGVPKRELPLAIRRFAVYVTKEEDLNTQQMWIRTGAECVRLLDSFVALGTSMYWTFWEEQTSLDQYRRGLPWKPDTPGKGAFAAIRGAFDFIGRLVNESDSCAAFFANAPLQYGKLRDDWEANIRVPAKIENFNLAAFCRYVQGEAAALTTVA